MYATADVQHEAEQSSRRTWWRCFALFAVAAVAWSLTTPLLSGPDEAWHAVRAAAVARGEIGADVPKGMKDVVIATVHVPEAYAKAGRMSCFIDGPTATPNCAPAFTGGSRRVPVATGEHRGDPWYYAAVGWPSLLFPASAGVYAMRIVSALICAAFLASAIASALAMRRTLAPLGVLVAITPEVLFLTGLINPNSLEIAAAICLWASALTLGSAGTVVSRRLVRRTGIALVVLVLARGLSPLFALLILGAAALVSDRARLLELRARTDVRRWAVGALVAAVAAAVWIAYARSAYPLRRAGNGVWHAFTMSGTFLRESVGVLSWRAVNPLEWPGLHLPAAVYVIWSVLGVALVVAACSTARRAHLAVLGAAIVAALALPVLVDGANFPPIGFGWQGRYGLPLLCGVPILAGALTNLDDARLRAARTRLRVLWPVAVALIVIAQVVAFLWMIRRNGVGYGGTANPLSYLFDAVWTPDTGPTFVYLIGFTAAVAGVNALVARRALEGEQTAVAGSGAERVDHE